MFSNYELHLKLQFLSEIKIIDFNDEMIRYQEKKLFQRNYHTFIDNDFKRKEINRIR